MPEVSHHIVRCYPHCIESPVFRCGGNYQVVFIRGKKKEKPPKGILQLCHEACHLSLEQLGLFGEAVIHFKSGSKGLHQRKLITYQVYSYNTPTAPGTIIGELSIDIAALVNAGVVNACHVRKRFDFSMCSYGAFIDVTIQVCEVVGGITMSLPVLKDFVSGPSGERSSLSPHMRMNAASSSHTPQMVTSAAEPSADVKYIARDTAMAMLVAIDDSEVPGIFERVPINGDISDCDSSSYLRSRSIPVVSPSLNDQTILVSKLISIRLHSIPHQYLLQRQTVVAEAKTAVHTTIQINKGNLQAVETSLRAQLQLSRARLVEARQYESAELYQEDAHVNEVIRNEGIISESVERCYPMSISNLALRLNSFTKTVPKPNDVLKESAALETDKLNLLVSTQAQKTPAITPQLCPEPKDMTTDLLASQLKKEQNPPVNHMENTGLIPAPQPNLFSEDTVTEQSDNTNTTSKYINASDFGDDKKAFSRIGLGVDNQPRDANPFSASASQGLKNGLNMFDESSATSIGQSTHYCSTSRGPFESARSTEENPSPTDGFEGRFSQEMFCERKRDQNGIGALQEYSVCQPGKSLFDSEDTAISVVSPALTVDMFSQKAESNTGASFTSPGNVIQTNIFSGGGMQLFAGQGTSLFASEENIISGTLGALSQQSQTSVAKGSDLFQ